MNDFLIVQSQLNADILTEQGFNNYDLTDLENSDRFRKEGNLKFKEGKYFAAIAQYNKGLICGRNDKVRSSLCYANRSAVYLELKYFKHCLHNIELAEENYPHENIKKLHDRREKCLKMMKNSVDKAIEAFVHTFKLSYEPNPKLPFFIDSLELKENSKIGKHLVSTRNLKAGDVIAVIDRPMREPMNSLAENCIQGCYNCHNTNNGDLIPDPGECKALFCSEACKLEHQHQNSNHKEINELENVFASHMPVSSDVRILLHMLDIFGSLDEMKKFVDEHRDKKHTVFDFDWSDPHDSMYYKNMLLVMMSTTKPRDDGKTLEYFRNTCSPFLKPDSQLIRILNGDKKYYKILDEIMHVIANRNRMILTPEGLSKCKIAHFFHPSMDPLTPSCVVNVYIITDRKYIYWIVNQPISAGTPLTLYYKFLRDTKELCFHCSKGPVLLSCNKDWSRFENKLVNTQGKTSYFIDFFKRNDPKNLTSWLRSLKSCCDFVNANFKRFEDPKMKLPINLKMLEIEDILLSIGNPFPPSNVYFNIDTFFNLVAKEKYYKEVFET